MTRHNGLCDSFANQCTRAGLSPDLERESGVPLQEKIGTNLFLRINNYISVSTQIHGIRITIHMEIYKLKHRKISTKYKENIRLSYVHIVQLLCISVTKLVSLTNCLLNHYFVVICSLNS